MGKPEPYQFATVSSDRPQQRWNNWQLTYSDFFKKYRYTVIYPELPLVCSKDGIFPLELCFSTGESYKALLHGAGTSDLIKFATAPAYTRRNQILEFLKLLAWHQQPILQAHGLSVNPNQMVVEGWVCTDSRLLGNNSLIKLDESCLLQLW